MAKQANKTLIGAFVIGAIALIVAAVLILGGGKFFRKTFKVVMFFEGSIKGLNIGSPVMWRGVKIGSVTDINLILNAKDLSAQTPVVVELDPERWILVGGEKGDVKRLQAIIERGLRAQLQMQSFVTGQLLIAFDFFPDKPVRFVGLVKEYPEIPTVPTSLEELSKTLEELPLKEIITKLDLTIDGIQKIVNSPDAREGVDSLNRTLKDTQKLVQHIDEQIDPLLSSLTKTSDVAHDTLATAKDALKSTQGTLKQAEKTLQSVQDATEQNADLGYEINRTLKELSASARSIRALTDYLERHPEALIRGK